MIPLEDLLENWEQHESYIEKLAHAMFGDTPMGKAILLAEERFLSILEEEKSTTDLVLFLVSDGIPTDITPTETLTAIERLKKLGTIIISCFLTDRNLTTARHLFNAPEGDWPEGAKLMFECASLLKPNSPYDSHLTEYGWTKDIGSRAFSQINHTNILEEFTEMVISPLRESVARKISLDSKNKVFISYSHKDFKWLERLQLHLKPIVRQGSMDVWADTKIEPGANWQVEIERALKTANFAILIVSANFMGSDFISAIELPRLLTAARNKGTVIIPLVISHSLFFDDPVLSQFQAINAPEFPLISLNEDAQEAIFVKLSREILTKLK